MDGPQWILGDDMGIRVDHIGIAVNNLDSSSEFWRLIGLEQGNDELNVEQGVNIRFFGSEQGTDATKIELLSPTSTNTPIGRFLEKKGPGVQQIAFRVDNLQELLDKQVASLSLKLKLLQYPYLEVKEFEDQSIL